MLSEQMKDKAIERLERRALFRKAGTGIAGAAAVAALASTALKSSPADAATYVIPPTASPTQSDVDILNFALNLEYLEASFYTQAVLGINLGAPDLAGGNGVAGATPITTGAGKVPFVTPMISQLADTIAADELAHVRFLKSALGAAAVPAPLLDVSVTGAFSTAARAAGLISGTQTFNPYGDENSFLLGGYLFEDVGVTAYAGAAGLLSMGGEIVQYAASILAMEAYHAGTIRTLLMMRGAGASTDAISNLRSTLSSGAGEGAPTGDDFGTYDPVNNVVVLAPRDSNALAYRRSYTQVLNIVYGNTVRTTGLFFPNGMNGNLK